MSSRISTSRNSGKGAVRDSQRASKVALQRVCVITGPTSGIGVESARALAALPHWKICLVARNCQKGEEMVQDLIQRTGNSSVRLVVADMAVLADVKRAAEEIRSHYRRVDVVLLNAGVWLPTRKETVDGHEETFQVNHLASYQLIHDLMPLLQKSRKARIVMVSSMGHRKGVMDFNDLEWKTRPYNQEGFGPYAASKLCNVLFTRELAKRLKGTNITANCLHPGVIPTALGATSGPISCFYSFFRCCLPSIQDGAKNSIFLASSPQVEGKTGGYYDGCSISDPSPTAKNDEIAKKLWDVSAQILGLDPNWPTDPPKNENQTIEESPDM